MFRWVVKEVESPYGSVATMHWAVADDDEAPDDVNETLLQQELERAEDQLGAVLWNSNTVALRYLENHIIRNNAKDYCIVELGAGVGCLGIALAMAGSRVVITDIKELVPLMQKNVELNTDRIRSRSKNQGSCEVLALRWGPPPRSQKQKQKGCDVAGRETNSSSQYTLPSPSFVELKKKLDRIDMVVLCDALYGNPKDWPHLLFTLSEILAANPSCEVINFCEQRVNDVEGGFLQLLQQENSRTQQSYANMVSCKKDEAMIMGKESVEREKEGEKEKEKELWSALTRMRGAYMWCAATEVVSEGTSDLEMTVRATRIRWALPKRGLQEVDDGASVEDVVQTCKRRKLTK